MKDFWLVVFNGEAKLIKNGRDNVIATKEICIQFFVTFFLRNKEIIVYERKSRNWNER